MNRWPYDLFAISFCILLLITCVGICAEPNSFARDGNNVARDSNGPKVSLDYYNDGHVTNPLSEFMYFVPLISPTSVDCEISENNQQKIRTISYQKKIGTKSFYVSCEFEIFGRGFYIDRFDPAGIMEIEKRETKQGRPLENLLDYIKFEGEGIGQIDAKGTVKNSVYTVTEVTVHYNARGRKSPVTVGIYSVKYENGQYKYENRYDELVARLNTITLKKSETNPRMDIKIASVHKKTQSESIWGDIEGALANLFMEPAVVSKLGNDTMLNFGQALLAEKPSFTFPKAQNIRQIKIVHPADK